MRWRRGAGEKQGGCLLHSRGQSSGSALATAAGALETFCTCSLYMCLDIVADIPNIDYPVDSTCHAKLIGSSINTSLLGPRARPRGHIVHHLAFFTITWD
jgi:hypothetical protein